MQKYGRERRDFGDIYGDDDDVNDEDGSFVEDRSPISGSMPTELDDVDALSKNVGIDPEMGDQIKYLNRALAR